jgi:hypothetical protein
MRIKHAAIITGLFFALNAPVQVVQVSVVQASTPWAFDPFMGKWSGALEYKDYSGGTGRVKVPVKLEVKPSDAGTANWYFNYDDFGKTVISDEIHTWKSGPSAGQYTIKTRGKLEVQEYSSKDFDVLLKAGIGKAILMGSELEDGKKVEVRRTITLEKMALTTLKETRPPNGVFAFRNQSTYTRSK